MKGGGLEIKLKIVCLKNVSIWQLAEQTRATQAYHIRGSEVQPSEAMGFEGDSF